MRHAQIDPFQQSHNFHSSFFFDTTYHLLLTQVAFTVVTPLFLLKDTWAAEASVFRRSSFSWRQRSISWPWRFRGRVYRSKGVELGSIEAPFLRSVYVFIYIWLIYARYVLHCSLVGKLYEKNPAFYYNQNIHWFLEGDVRTYLSQKYQMMYPFRKWELHTATD